MPNHEKPSAQADNCHKAENKQRVHPNYGNDLSVRTSPHANIVIIVMVNAPNNSTEQVSFYTKETTHVKTL